MTELTSLVTRRPRRPAGELLDALRRLWVALEDEPAPPDDLAPCLLQTIKDVGRPAPERLELAKAAAHFWPAGALHHRIVAEIARLEVAAEFGDHADPALVAELEDLRRRHRLADARIRRLAAIDDLTDVVALWALQQQAQANHEVLRGEDWPAARFELQFRLRVLRRLLDLHPGTRELNALSAVYRRLGDPRRAMTVNQASLGLDDDTRSNRAGWTVHFALLRDLGEPGAADRAVRRLLEEAPDDPYLLATAGGIAIDQGRLGEADRYFARAAELRDPGPDVHRGLERLIAGYRAAGAIADAERVEALAFEARRARSGGWAARAGATGG